MELVKRHDTTQQTQRTFARANLLRGNWCNGFWALLSMQFRDSACMNNVLYLLIWGLTKFALMLLGAEIYIRGVDL